MVSIAVTTKNTLRSQVETAVGDIRSMAYAKFHGKGFYQTFHFANLTNLSEADLVRAVRRVVRVATTFQP